MHLKGQTNKCNIMNSFNAFIYKNKKLLFHTILALGVVLGVETFILSGSQLFAMIARFNRFQNILRCSSLSDFGHTI